MGKPPQIVVGATSDRARPVRTRAGPGLSPRVTQIRQFTLDGGRTGWHDGFAMSAPTLIGRTAEVIELESALARAADGAPQFVLLAGEAGVGKSRLVTDFLRDCRAVVPPAPVVSIVAGACVPVAGEGLPYAPIIQGLRELFRALPDAERRRLLDRWPRELVSFVPEAPGADPMPTDTSALGAAATVTAVSSALDAPSSSSGQVRLFESLLVLLGRLGRRGPVVLVAEDLHWADRSSLDLLAFLAQNLRSEPVLILLTYRDDELPRGAPLHGWLAELARLPATTRRSLQRLGRADTSRHIAALAGRQPEGDLVDAVFSRSAGNPLFTEHLLAGAADAGPGMPATLSELLGARVAGLPEATRRVLGVAAVVGRSAPLALLAAVADTSEDEVEEALRPAIERHVVEPRDDMSYGFRHPAFREVVSADLLPGARRRLHARVADALARQPAGGPVERAVTAGAIARHWRVASDRPRAYRAAVDAGLAAGGVYAFAEADEHLRWAVELAPVPSDAELAAAGLVAPDRIELLAAAAEAAHLSGDGKRAAALVEDAIGWVDEPVRQAALYERLGSFHFLAGRAPQAEDSYQQALALLPVDDPSPLRARVMAGLGMLAMAWTRLDVAHGASVAAIGIARAAGARRELGTALNALGVVTAYRGDVDAGVEHLRQALAIAHELDNADDLAAAYIHLCHVLGVAGRFDEAVAVGREGYEVMCRVGLQRQDGSFLQANAAECLIKAGRWSEAAALLDDAMSRRTQGLRAFPVLVQSARLAIGRSELELAADLLGQIRDLIEASGAPDSWRRELLEATAELALWRRDPAAAHTAALDGLVIVEQGDERRFAAPLVAMGLRALADQGEDARARQDVDGLARTVEAGQALAARAARLDPNPLDDAGGWFPESPAQAAQGRAELARLLGDPSSAMYCTAAERWTVLGRPYRAAYCRLREGEARLVERQTGGQPIAALREAHATAESLGARGLAAEAAALARWHRIDLVPPVEERAEAEPSATDQLGLTARELEVLGALAAGQTNREIAESLFISVKTASVHVSNILRKLDVPARGEAARVAHRLGILR